MDCIDHINKTRYVFLMSSLWCIRLGLWFHLFVRMPAGSKQKYESKTHLIFSIIQPGNLNLPFNLMNVMQTGSLKDNGVYNTEQQQQQ